ncbi:hypothetical protein ACFV6F_12180 [Kitasatospora phosalacinea]|uniref:hypothetical protein n=1 Tax=Kitasatospora phosalacinea TaxID=2065 RepID=UPI0036670CFC
MVNDVAGQGSAWWALVRESAAACWWRLLVVNVVFLVAVNVLNALVGSAGAAPEAAAVLLFAAGSVLSAWRWSAQLRVLDGESDPLRAFRTDRSPVLRLALLSSAVNLPGLLWVLSVLFPGGYESLARPLLPVLDPIALYLAAVAAMLPMAVLLEGRDLRRSWQLLHGSWASALRIGLVVLGQAVLPRVVPGTILMLLLDPACAVLLYASYRLSLREGGGGSERGGGAAAAAG